MNRKLVFSAMPACLLALILVFAACTNPAGGGPQTTTYSGTTGGKIYTLVITEGARYAAQTGDAYVLTVTQSGVSPKTNSGTVTVSGGVFTLTPSTGTTFTVTVTGNSISGISAGTITFTGGSPETFTGSESFTSVYTLSWGAWDGANYSTVSGNFSSFGTLTTFPGVDNAAYLKGTAATTAYNSTLAYIAANPQSAFNTFGEESSSFEGLLAMPDRDGATPPSGLKEALPAQKDNVPLAVIFRYAGGTGAGYGVVVFYITKN
jgi:hypothetical protein